MLSTLASIQVICRGSASAVIARANSIGNSRPACFAKTFGGKVDNLAVEGFDLGVRFVVLIGHRNRMEARAKEVFTGKVGECHPLHA